MSFTAHLKAGITIYNAGEFHAAHDAWEAEWLSLEKDIPDEQFLHGLIQFTAAIYHAHNRNWVGAQGLANSASDYLSILPTTYRDVPLSPIREYLNQLALDPEVIERTPAPPLTYDDLALGYGDLTPTELVIVAEVIAEEYEYDETIVTDAITYAEPALSTDTTNPFLTLLTDFVTNEPNRDLIFNRLQAHVDRQRTRDEPVTDLFDDP